MSSRSSLQSRPPPSRLASCRSSAALLPACALAGLNPDLEPVRSPGRSLRRAETGHLTIQSAINDARCTEIDLKAQIIPSRSTSTGGSSGNATRPGGRAYRPGQPLRRNRSTVSTTFLRNYVYVVQVAPAARSRSPI